jgi:1-pyrroline-5-carboxylate dehydrogenase
MLLLTKSLHRSPLHCVINRTAFHLFRAHFSSTPASQKSVPSWATIDPEQLGVSKIVHHVDNIVDGKWQRESGTTKHDVITIPNPLHKSAPPIFTIADLTVADLYPFSASLKAVSKSGLHNPLKNIHRYLMYGEITRKVWNNTSSIIS